MSKTKDYIIDCVVYSANFRRGMPLFVWLPPQSLTRMVERKSVFRKVLEIMDDDGTRSAFYELSHTEQGMYLLLLAETL